MAKPRRTPNNIGKARTARSLLGDKLQHMEQSEIEENMLDRLSSAWNAFVEGRASVEDAEVIMADLASDTGFFYVAPPGATGEDLNYREGKRSVYGRILFLLDRPVSYMEALRRAALDELQIEQRTEV